jgi:hypothetical protein
MVYAAMARKEAIPRHNDTKKQATVILARKARGGFSLANETRFSPGTT